MPNNPRIAKFDGPKRKELSGLARRKTWEIVLAQSLPKNANVLSGTFVLTIKDEGTERETWKERFVVQGHTEKLKRSIVHDNSVVLKYFIKLLVGLSSLFCFRSFSTDVTQAYLQSNDKLQRDVYVRAPSELVLQSEKFLKLLKPLYGPSKSDDY